ncbi:hypothetical protein SADUNF_Sadunf04G0125400 [Salix dunnii]|uniref:Uncharacterized protein n=1 Tax=Salix dunnii TaxID=1413687 RepID=A0A835KC52_9ROSI|nr:hypothetical protein SADUNF_Sadunf04G0125400 [Salix dunnii]
MMWNHEPSGKLSAVTAYQFISCDDRSLPVICMLKVWPGLDPAVRIFYGLQSIIEKKMSNLQKFYEASLLYMRLEIAQNISNQFTAQEDTIFLLLHEWQGMFRSKSLQKYCNTNEKVCVHVLYEENQKQIEEDGIMGTTPFNYDLFSLIVSSFLC